MSGQLGRDIRRAAAAASRRVPRLRPLPEKHLRGRDQRSRRCLTRKDEEYLKANTNLRLIINFLRRRLDLIAIIELESKQILRKFAQRLQLIGNKQAVRILLLTIDYLQ